MGDYKGPEKRKRKTQKEHVRAAAERLARERVHISELITRRTDPKDFAERVRGHLKSLIEEPEKLEKQPKTIHESKFEEITEETSWLLPDSEPERKGQFVQAFNKVRGGVLKAVLLVLARAGEGSVVSRAEMIRQVSQMLPQYKSISSCLSMEYIIDPGYMKKIGLRVDYDKFEGKTYSLRFL